MEDEKVFVLYSVSYTTMLWRCVRLTDERRKTSESQIELSTAGLLVAEKARTTSSAATSVQRDAMLQREAMVHRKPMQGVRR